MSVVWSRRPDFDARNSELATSSHQTSQQAFPFSQLPLDLRYEICLLLLASESPTEIVVDESPIGKERLRLSWDSWRERFFILNTGLLYLNRSIYEEAISVLYGHNFFRFLGNAGWNTFYLFHRSLSEASRQHLRSLQFEFPALDGGHFDRCITSFRGLQGLKTLRFRLCRDITRKDIIILRKMHENFPDGCQVTLAKFLEVEDGRDFRYPEITSRALTKIRDWNWIIEEKERNWNLAGSEVWKDL